MCMYIKGNTAKCVDNLLLHSIRVAKTVQHQICSTEFPFDLPMQSVTCVLVWYKWKQITFSRNVIYRNYKVMNFVVT